tara:strand:+ start:4447 stop:4764 length:318 start_codon:yes stop_codon:yes gene_type:complete
MNTFEIGYYTNNNRTLGDIRIIKKTKKTITYVRYLLSNKTGLYKNIDYDYIGDKLYIVKTKIIDDEEFVIKDAGFSVNNTWIKFNPDDCKRYIEVNQTILKMFGN